MDTLLQYLDLELFSFGSFRLTPRNLVTVVMIFLLVNFLLWITKLALTRRRKKGALDRGSYYAVYQIIKYFVWIATVALVLETLGVKVTVLVAGSAALLVGLGLGLQQIFNDVISGIILLSEGTIKVGDIVEMDGEVIRVEHIGLRTSKGMNRNEIVIIIPNSKITGDRVINWSHQVKKTRFRINVGVAYGSDVNLVVKVLEESALEHPDVSEKNLTEARLIDFGSSSLDFELVFFSENVFRIEKVKSDIRKIISRKLDENNITIPFPQVDVHMKEK